MKVDNAASLAARWQHDAVLDPKAACQSETHRALIRWPAATHRWHKQHGVDRTQSLATVRGGEKEGVMLHSLREKLYR